MCRSKARRRRPRLRAPGCGRRRDMRLRTRNALTRSRRKARAGRGGDGNCFGCRGRNRRHRASSDRYGRLGRSHRGRRSWSHGRRACRRSGSHGFRLRRRRSRRGDGRRRLGRRGARGNRGRHRRGIRGRFGRHSRRRSDRGLNDRDRRLRRYRDGDRSRRGNGCRIRRRRGDDLGQLVQDADRPVDWVYHGRLSDGRDDVVLHRLRSRLRNGGRTGRGHDLRNRDDLASDRLFRRALLRGRGRNRYEERGCQQVQ